MGNNLNNIPKSFNFKKHDKVSFSDFPDKIFRVFGYEGKFGFEFVNGKKMPKSYIILEDWHDKNTPKKKRHNIFSVNILDAYKISKV